MRFEAGEMLLSKGDLQMLKSRFKPFKQVSILNLCF